MSSPENNLTRQSHKECYSSILLLKGHIIKNTKLTKQLAKQQVHMPNEQVGPSGERLQSPCIF